LENLREQWEAKGTSEKALKKEEGQPSDGQKTEKIGLKRRSQMGKSRERK
jgi:hypothetical protein